MHTMARNEAQQRGDLRAFYDEAEDVRDSLGPWAGGRGDAGGPAFAIGL